jgi:hypothetical protein
VSVLDKENFSVAEDQQPRIIAKVAPVATTL